MLCFKISQINVNLKCNFKGGDNQESNKEKENASSKSDTEWQQPANTSEAASNSNLQYSLTISEGRSLPNVLKRISNLVALKNVVSKYYE